MPRLTKRLIDTTALPQAGETVLWDTTTPGFGVRCYPSGRRVFFVRYRTPRGRKRYALGPYGVLTVEQARSLAQAVLVRVRIGDDPAETRQATREAPTVADLAARYLTEHAVPKKKPGSLRSDRYNLRLHILPALGHLPVPSVQPADVTALQHALRQTPGAANRCLALLSTMFRLAEQWGWRATATNPARGLTRYRERPRERFLSLADVRCLGEALAEAEAARLEMPSVMACIRLLLLTGARLSEVLRLKWAYIDGAIAWLPDSKTGAKPLYLSPPAVTLLASLPRVSLWVLPGKHHGKPLSNPHRPWYRLRARANLGDIRLHDLRHTFASIGVQSGLSLPLIGAVLGHHHAATTQRYAHHAADPVQQAAAQIGGIIAQALLPQTG